MKVSREKGVGRSRGRSRRIPNRITRPIDLPPAVWKGVEDRAVNAGISWNAMAIMLLTRSLDMSGEGGGVMI